MWPRKRRSRKNPDAAYRRARRRLSTMAPASILGWSDQIGSEVLTALDAYRRHESAEAIADARMAANVMLAVVDELESRYREKAAA